MDINKKIGEKLNALRLAHDYSLEDIAIKVGKSRKTIHAYEKGTIEISVSNLQKILDIYGESVGRFLDNIK
ncbi:helix-turn-helix domain-containing protein [Erysipelothrix anatis]|uniref:helix-turn-helix domain-containing protein n=1 Tax=Erysipelothrix anatis TaxID=2683713 RepID=UPI001356E53F|nr:helix-turn-helix transcriptional regulator [Erysipelothrix anatis]